MQTSKTDLGGLLRKHATSRVETPTDFTRLPGGIDDGRAQVVVATVGEFKTGPTEGEKFIRLAATVYEPVMALDVKRIWDKDAPNPRDPKKRGAVKIVEERQRKVAGLQTSVMLPLCASGWDDTKKEFAVSADENIKDALNMLNLVAGCDERTPDDQLFTRTVVNEAALVECLKHLEAAAPFIKFTTSDLPPSAKYPEPKVFERWYGSKGLENYAPPSVGTDVGKSVMPPQNGHGNGSGPPHHLSAPTTQVAESSISGLTAAATAGGPDADGALSELLSLAKQQVPDAQEQMLNIAVSVGVTQETLDGTDDWQVVYDAIIAAQRGSQPTGAPPPPAAPDPMNPKVGEHYFYKVSRAMPRGVEVKVDSINADGTVKATNVSNPKMVYNTLTRDKLMKTPTA